MIRPLRLVDPPGRASDVSALLSLAALALFLLLIPSDLSGQTGTVVGTAVQEEDGRPLVGASVVVAGTALGSLTDEDGRYRISRVPAGPATLRLSYVGRETTRMEVDVPADGIARADFAAAPAPVAVEGITVLGTRAMTQARALSEQKGAPNIKNVVASDQIGRFPDASAPEAIQRIPGIAIERDQGEGRYIQIRGGRSEYTTVNLNGASVPSPEGEERQVALDAVPVDILESIEVVKAITPDMDASAVGGAVNLVTRTAPVNPTLGLEAAGGYAPLREEPAGKAALTWGRRFAGNRWGLLLSGSYSNRDFGSDDIEPEYDFEDPGLGDDVLVEFQTRHYTLTRERLGGTATLDFRPDDDSEIRFTGTYTQHEDTEARRVLNSVLEDNELAYEHKYRRETLEIANVGLRGEHVLGSGVELDYGLSYSRSAEDTPFDNEIFFLEEDVSFAPDMRDPDRIRPNPAASAVSGPFPFDGIDIANSLTTNEDVIGSVDLGLPYSLGEASQGVLRLGLKVRDKDKDQEIFESEGELDGDLDLAGFGEAFSLGDYVPGAYEFPGFSTTNDQVRTFPDRFAGQLETEVDLEAETEDYLLDERVTSGYVLTELDVSERLLFLPGVRYEHTDFESQGFEFDPDTESLTPVTGSKDYGNWFPMAHLRYQATPQTNLRAAYTSTISRPNFFNLVPFRIRDDEDLEVGNPDLDPATSRNVDLMVEHYNQRIGVVSAGVFAKWIDDPIFLFTFENDLGGDTEQPGNGESGWIRGAELAVQQQLTFLPGALAGLGIYANYTFTDSEGELPGGRTAQLLGQADHTINAALSYERAGFSGQLSFNWRDSYIDEYGDEALEDEYVGDRHQLDLTASYAIGNGAIYAEFLNLTNEPFTLFQGVEERPRQIEYYRPWGWIGFRITR